MKTIELKTDPDVFQAVWDSKKNFEIRFNDRNYEVGDTLTLKETRYSGTQMHDGAELIYTGREVDVRVTYILKGPLYGLSEGWVIMSFDDSQPTVGCND